MASILQRNKRRDKALLEKIKSSSGTVFESVGFFIQLSPIFKQLEQNSASLNAETTILAKNVSLYYGKDLLAPAQPVKKESLSEINKSISKSTEDMKKRGIDLAILGALIPMLLNKEAREYLASFLKGLIGVENIEKIKTILKVVTATLTGIFAYKLFKQVSDTITSLVRLSQLTATLFTLTDEGADGLLDKEERIKKKLRKKNARDRLKRRKERQIKLKQRASRLNRIKKIKNLKKVISIISKGLKVTPVTAIAGIGISIGAGALLNFIIGNEEASAAKEDLPEAPEPEDKDLGEDADIEELIGDEEEAPEEAVQVDTEDEKGGEEDNIKEKIVDSVKTAAIDEVKSYVDLVSWIPGVRDKIINWFTKGTQSEAQAEQSKQAPIAAIMSPPIPVNAPAQIQQLPQQPQATQPTSTGQQLQPATPSVQAPTTGQQIAQTSETVKAAKSDMQMQASVVNVDNSTYVKQEQTNNVETRVTASSTSVGK